ncbi:MAG: MBL fold metallo-hydrolase [Motilibacteraceae bacterium]
MLVAGFPARAFGTNCYVVAPGAGEECVVVDPGIDVVPQLDEVLAEHRLRPVAVLLTHGHLDHTFSVTPVCGARDVPAFIHPDDAELLADPAKGMGPQLQAMMGQLTWTEPDDVRTMDDGAVLHLAGLEITVDHAPGHTRGSVMFRLPAQDLPDEASQLCLSGDVLFAGSIGRTDLPGGDTATMLRSLTTKVLPLPDDVLVLPGHGDRTTIGRERATNPFLRQLQEDGEGAPAAPTRGL